LNVFFYLVKYDIIQGMSKKREFLFVFVLLSQSLFANSTTTVGKTPPTPSSLQQIKDFECAAGEIPTKMKNGDYACCPNGSGVCYPPISSKNKQSKKCEPGESLTLMKGGDYACCPKGQDICYKLSE
jgi:hypothetical protein